MRIDIQTLTIVQSLLNILQFMALFAQYRVDKTHRGLGWWVLGSVCLGLGFAANAMRDLPTLGLIAIIANNVLFVAGSAALYVGVRRFFDQHVPHRLLIAFCATFTLLISYFTYGNNDLTVRRTLLSVAIAGLGFVTAQALFVSSTRSFTASARFLAVVFLGMGGFFSLRVLATLTGAPVENAFSATLAQTATLIVVFIASALWTFGFIMMVNQRLVAENREAKETAELMFNTSPDAVLITRLHDGAFVNINDGFTAMTGYTRTNVLRQSTLTINLWHDPADRHKLILALNEQGFCHNLEAVFQRKDGSQLIGMVSARFMTLQGEPHMISVTHDITQRKQAEDALRASEQRYRLLADHANDVIWTMTLDGKFTYLSPSVYQLRGFTPEEVLQQSLTQVVCPSSSATVQEGFRRAFAEINTGQRQPTQYFEIEQPRKDGTTVWTEATARVMYDDAGQPIGLVGVSRDITERKRLEGALQHQANTDGLTGVVNRRRFLELAQGECIRALRLNHPLAIAVIDLDHFKQINDSYGHAVGDQALVAWTRICQQQIRVIDLLARFGGDEFALLLPETTATQARTVLEQVCRALAAQPIDVSGNTVTLTISAGIASLAHEAESLDTLLERADRALYQAKAAGRNRVVVEAGVACSEHPSR